MSEKISAGGWCAPRDAVYDATALNLNEYVYLAPVFPEVRVTRGGIRFHAVTPEDRRLSQMRLVELAAEVSRRHDEAIAEAVRIATENSFDLHVYHRDLGWVSSNSENAYRLQRHIGIRFEPAKYGVPTIHEHRDHDVTFEWD